MSVSKFDQEMKELAHANPGQWGSYKLFATLEPDEIESIVLITEFHEAECSWYLLPCGGTLSPILVAEDKRYCDYPFRAKDNEFEPNSLKVQKQKVREEIKTLEKEIRNELNLKQMTVNPETNEQLSGLYKELDEIDDFRVEGRFRLAAQFDLELLPEFNFVP